MNSYKPIACALHEHFQFAVIKKMPLDLVWFDDGLRRMARVNPIDVYTQRNAEYLRGEIKNLGEVEIRLDFIRQARWVSNGRLLGE